MSQHLIELNREFEGSEPEKIIEKALELIGSDKLVLASSLSIEDQVLTHILIKAEPKARIFFIDTGRHFQNTYDLLDETRHRYEFNFEVYAPETKDLEVLISEKGANFFYESVNLRKKCCEIRKVNPLNRVLATSMGWICGLRREQSPTRQSIEHFEWDEERGIYKINPIAGWTENQVWDYIKKHNIPYNTLYNKGFRSIGCQPCTRAVSEGEDIRNGRWWWEDPDKKECGLHLKHS